MNRSMLSTARAIVFAAPLIAAAACDYKAPTAPDSQTPAGPEGATVTITSAGLTPATVTIAMGQSVTFVNNDTQVHEVVSGPAPSYDQCPAINRVGRLEPGQSMQTGALSATRTCAFLDLLRIDDSRWQGTIAVQ